jgi:hypothetical protein
MAANIRMGGIIMTSLNTRTLLVLAISLLVLAFASGCANSKSANATGENGDKPSAQKEQVQKPEEIDYSTGLNLWKEILSRHVDNQGLVDYQGIKDNREDHEKLQKFIDSMKNVDPEKLETREKKLAFWINCYNAATIHGVLRHYPIDSVKDVKDFWHIVVVSVGGKEYSLGKIENTVLRGLGEPRMHWAIVRTSKSSAALLAEPYSADKLEEQLEKQEKDYIVGRRQAYINRKKIKLMLSPFFYWYGEDFIKKAGTKLDYVKKYFTKEDLDFLDDNPVSTGYIKPDWSLNRQKKK